jgi:hypothetical protein
MRIQQIGLLLVLLQDCLHLLKQLCPARQQRGIWLARQASRSVCESEGKPHLAASSMCSPAGSAKAPSKSNTCRQCSRHYIHQRKILSLGTGKTLQIASHLISLEKQSPLAARACSFFLTIALILHACLCSFWLRTVAHPSLPPACLDLHVQSSQALLKLVLSVRATHVAARQIDNAADKLCQASLLAVQRCRE